MEMVARIKKESSGLKKLIDVEMIKLQWKIFFLLKK